MRDESPVAVGPQGLPVKQFTTVHALRGVAALWVVLFHVYKSDALVGLDLARFPNATRFLLDYGRGGVAMFFVISGFVILHSLRNAAPDGNFVARFMLRRSIRLDPPYWVSIVLTLLVGVLAAERRGLGFALPSLGSVAAHLLYLQELVRAPEIQVTYWTLTYEVQFYLTLVLALWWVAHWRRRGAGAVVTASLPAALLLLGFVAAGQTGEWVLHGLFLNYWHAFVAGCLAYAAGHNRNNIAAGLLAVLVVMMLITAPATSEVFNSPAALTAIGLAVAGRMNGLSRGLNLAPLQFLGTISYSLYLVHIPAIVVSMSLGVRVFSQTPAGAISLFLFVLAASIAGSALFWWVIERPTHRLARHVRDRRARSPVLHEGESSAAA